VTIREVIDNVDDIKPNAFLDETKLRWINRLEGRICLDVFLMTIDQANELAYKHPDNMNTELLVQHPHDDIYEEWLKACIDEANGEYTKYANNMALFNGKYRNFGGWFAREYKPAQGHVRMDGQF